MFIAIFSGVLCAAAGGPLAGAWGAEASLVRIQFRLEGLSGPEVAQRMRSAEEEARRLLGDGARRTLSAVADGPGPSLEFRGSGWSYRLSGSERAGLIDALRSEWGPRLRIEAAGAAAPAAGADDGAAAGRAAWTVAAAARISASVPESLTQGRFGAAFDGSGAHAPAELAAPAGAIPSAGAMPGACAPAPGGSSDAAGAPTTAAEGEGLVGGDPPGAGPRSPPIFDPSAMDRSADPCADFFQYSCGGWLKNNPVPADETTWMRFNEIDAETRLVLKDVLEKAASARDPQTSAQRKIGDLYASCMDERSVAARGAEPLRPDLEGIDRLASKADLAAEIARLHAQGVAALFDFSSAQNYQNAAKLIANADQGGISLPDRAYYVAKEHAEDRAAYAGHVRKMFELLGDEPDQAAAEAGRVLRVETALARVSMDVVSLRDPYKVHDKTSLKALERETPSFDWRAYLAGVGAPRFRVIDVSSSRFFRGLEGVLRTTSLASWKSYLRWQVLNARAEYLPEGFVQEDFAFYGRRLRGQRELQPRWKRCVDLVDSAMGDALGREYVKRKFDPERKELASDMVRRVEAAMKEELEQSAWMTPGTRRNALAKLRAVRNKIGYPDRWETYPRLRIARGDLMGNIRRADAFATRQDLAAIGRRVNRGSWGMTPPTDNAYYDPQMNDINFPAGVLQPPLFDVRADAAENYGATGATMGHELKHAFDDEGRHYDGRGNLREWSTPKDAAAFKAGADAFVKEYDGFVAVEDPARPDRGVHVNGRLTLGENLADNGGLRLAYMAYRRVSGGASRPPGPGGFTPDQRFFLSYGQSWCGSRTPEAARLQASVDPHSPPEYRVNGVVSNMPEFARAFACKPGAPMSRQPPNVAP